MNSFYSFDFIHMENGRPRRFAVVSCPLEQVRIPVLIDEITHFMDRTIPPDQLVLLGGQSVREQLHIAAEDRSFLAKLPAATRFSNPPVVRCFTYDIEGSVSEASMETPDTGLIESLKKTGLANIFKTRGGMLEPSPTHHYIKPSQAHSNRFMRTGNVLVSSAETNFLAFCLMQYLRRDTSHIYCDTASINSVAYALVALKKSIDPSHPFPAIESFGSYEGIRNFHFHGAQNSLVLVSASTTGSLASKLLATKYIAPERIITLFYVGAQKPPGRVLSDLTRDSQIYPDGYEPILNYPSDKCQLCQRGSTPIEILGDQFLTGEPKVTTYTIKQSDPPKWLVPFMKQFGGKEFVHCHYDELIPNRARELHFDLSNIFSLPEALLRSEYPAFSAKFQKLLTQSVPASLCRIVHLDGTSSTEMAERVAEFFRSQYQGGRSVEVISAKAISNFSPEHVREVGTTMVVASCVVSGRSLMAISQFLRNIQTNGSISFLIGIGRTHSRQVFDEVRSNVRYGKYGPADYDFHYIDSIYVPDDPPEKLSPWEEERRFLFAFRERFGRERGFPTEFVEERIFQIANAKDASQKGLRETLFWPTPQGARLKLRRNIAFFSFERDFSQADTYLSLASILHHLREEGETPGPMVQRGYHRTLLAPQNFSRYNDGVMQASLLRAALREEMNYCCSAQASRVMKEILTFIFANLDNEQGEATPEFLLALAQQRLRIKREDLEPLLRDIETRSDLTPVIRFLCRYANEVAE